MLMNAIIVLVLTFTRIDIDDPAAHGGAPVVVVAGDWSGAESCRGSGFKPPGCGSEPPGCGLKPPGCGLKPPGCGLKPPGCGLKATGVWLKATGVWLKASRRVA
jgi:hypothetical protein